MALSFAPPARIEVLTDHRLQDELEHANQVLSDAFGVRFTFWDGATGERVSDGSGPACDDLLVGELSRVVSKNSQPEIIYDDDSLLILAIPVKLSVRDWHTATAVFVSEEATAENRKRALEKVGLGTEDGERWLSAQQAWDASMLLRFAEQVFARLLAEWKGRYLDAEVEKVSDNLASTYEEICLLHAVTQNLRISQSETELGRRALDRLFECIPIEGVALQLLPVPDAHKATYEARTKPTMICGGDCPLDNEVLTQIIEKVGLKNGAGPYVANANVTSSKDWQFDGVRQLIIVPVSDGKNLFGWLVAVNHLEDQEFGTVEANLLASLGAMLGTHSGNRELYRQQREFMAEVVRALTSALDAKDPYTCGHSDRVARVSVRLAQEMGCDEKFLDTIYMAGLLHDTGKIGIDDSVLRKPGRLTDEEFEQIKLHPEIGYRILSDLKQLRDCLPAVLHHHEQWDGEGYPHKLAGEDIPLIARIMAVADSYDAMQSDRPYRKGMPISTVDSILKAGGGQQWDQRVIDAYFAARDDIRDISGRERANLTLNVQKWTQTSRERP